MAVMMEVIEWVDMGGADMVHRWPENGSADIKAGAQLVVRDSQAAVFFKSGKGYDVVGPGRHMLSSLNVPLLTRALSLPWGFKSPIRCEVYFANLKTFTNLKWGTKDPVAFRDRELGLVRLRGYGVYTCRIVEPLLFINTLVGREAAYTTDDISDYLRDVIVARINDLFGEKLDTIFDLPKQYVDLASEIKKRVESEFSKYGLELLDFYITSITPPDEVQGMIDQKSSMQAVGDLDSFLKFSLAKAMNEGGRGSEAGSAMGLGAGVGMIIPSMLTKACGPNQRDLRPDPLPTVTCPKCGSDTPEQSRFCYKCGYAMVAVNRCGECGADLSADAKFCPSCGQRVGERHVCPACRAKVIPGSKFCTNCGEQLDGV